MLIDENDKFDVSGLDNEIELYIRKHKLNADVGKTSKGTIYRVMTNQASLEIVIGNKWIGYDFQINKPVLGKSVGVSEDTDNYPLGGEYAESSYAIFNSALACLRGLVEGKIYIGKVNDKITLAIPVDEDNYKVITRRNFFAGSRNTIKSEDLPQELLRHPIKF